MEYGLKQYIFVIRELTAREIKRKYSRSVLGILWSVLNPLLFMAVMSVVFSGFSTNKTEYPIYYLTGHTFWSMFSTATGTSMTVFYDNQNLFRKTKLPREIFVLSRAYTAFVNWAFSCVALFLVVLIFDGIINWTIVILFIDVLFELLFSIGISFILATIYVFYKDIKFIWKNVVVLLVHMIALYIPIERYPENIQKITKYNPLFFYPNIARNCVLNGTVESDELILMSVCAITTFFIGLLIFKIKENDIYEKL